MINQEIFEQQFKEIAAMDTMQFAIPPDSGFMLASVVQAAAMLLDLPETTDAFCKEFVNGFCDRYRDQMPTVVKSIEDAWGEGMVTEEEFEETLGEKWQRIAQDVEKEMGGEVKIIVDTPDDMHEDFFRLVYDLYQDIDLNEEDDRDPSEKPCPCGKGTTTLRDCDGRPCGFIQTYEDIPLCPPEISKELGYEEDDDYLDIITRKSDD